MVRIPDRPYAHISRALPDASAAGRIAAASHAGALMPVIAEGLDRFAHVALRMQKERDHDLLVEAQNRYTRSMTDYSVNAEQARTGGGARGFARDFAGTSDRERDGVLQWLKENGGSGEAKRAFTNWATGRKTTGGARAARFEHGQLLAHSRDLFDQRVQGISAGLERDPRAFGDAAAQLEEAFTMAAGQGLFRPEEAKTRLNDAREKLGLTAFDNLYAMDPGQAMSAMAGFGLSPARQARAKKRYQQDVRADAAIARAERAEKAGLLLAGLDDADTLGKLSGDTAEMEAIGKNLSAIGDTRGAAILRRAGLYREQDAVRRESREIPLSDLAASIREEEGRKEAAGAGRDADALGKSALALDVRREIYAKRLAALKDDPALAVSERAVKIAGADPAPASLAAARLRVQEADGVPASLRKILPKEEAAALSLNFRGADAAVKLGTLEQIKQIYGAHAARVLDELDLNPLEVSLAKTALSSGPAAQAFAELSAAAGMKDAELPQLDEGTRAAKLREVNRDSSRLSIQRKLLAEVMPGNADLAARIRLGENAAGRLLHLRNGDANAVIKALDAGIDTIDENNICVEFSAGINSGDLRAALAAKTRLLAEFDEFLPGYAQGEKKEARVKNLRSRGIWINAPDGDGFVLADPRAQAPIIDRKGEFFRVRPGEIAGLAEDVNRTLREIQY